MALLMWALTLYVTFWSSHNVCLCFICFFMEVARSWIWYIALEVFGLCGCIYCFEFVWLMNCCIQSLVSTATRETVNRNSRGTRNKWIWQLAECFFNRYNGVSAYCPFPLFFFSEDLSEYLAFVSPAHESLCCLIQDHCIYIRQLCFSQIWRIGTILLLLFVGIRLVNRIRKYVLWQSPSGNFMITVRK